MNRTPTGYRRGDGHHRSRLREVDVVLIWELRAEGMSYQAIADKLDDYDPPIAWRTVTDVLMGRTWTHVPVPDELLRAVASLAHNPPDDE